MKEAKFPVSDQQMMVLLSKYPFLKHNKYWVKDKELVAREVYSEELENNEHNWYKIWDGHGWERLWKLYFMPRLFKLYNSWDDEKKSQFYFVDTKSKYGSLRLSTSFSLPDDMELILEWMSEFICETCGAEPKDEKGHHIIYETNVWITHQCETCLRKYLSIAFEVMPEDSQAKTIQNMKRVALSFGYKRTNHDGSIERRYKYNKDDDWLVLDSETQENS